MATRSTTLLLDLSQPAGDVALFGAQVFTATLANGTLEHGYAAEASMRFSQAQTDLRMSLSHSLSAMAAGSLDVASHQQDALIDLSAVTLRVAGGVGETAGSAVMVRFSGNASAWTELNAPAQGGYLGLGLSVARGNDVVGEYLWDVTQTGDQTVDFSFAATVGEQLSFSGYLLSGASLDAAPFATGPSAYSLVNTGASLAGDFTISAVPEPQAWALLLAGIALVGARTRGRSRT